MPLINLTHGLDCANLSRSLHVLLVYIKLHARRDSWELIMISAPEGSSLSASRRVGSGIDSDVVLVGRGVPFNG